MAKGIIGQLQLMGVVVLAIPVGLLGVDFLLNGQALLGVAFLGIAVLMVAAEEYITRPTDVATDAATRAAGKVVKKPGDGADDGDETDFEKESR